MNEIEKPKWVGDALELLENAFNTSEDAIVSGQAERLKKLLPVLKMVDLENLPRWRRQWIEWWIDLITMINACSDKTIEDESEDPPWLEKVEIELGQSWGPTIRFSAFIRKHPVRSPIEVLGGLVGHSVMNIHPDCPGIVLLLSNLPNGQREIYEYMFENQRASILPACGSVIAMAQKQSLHDIRRFFRGYSLALQKGSIRDTGELAAESPATKIYFMLSSYSGFVSQLQSVRELFEWLQMQLGKNLINDTNGLNRVEKICQRIGLHFAPPGRPAQS